MAILPDASAALLHPFITDHVEPGTAVGTDGWPSYSGSRTSATCAIGAVSARTTAP
jgi:hypothetical protein